MVLVIASQRTRAKSRGPMTGSAKQSRAACDGWEAVLDCFVAIAPRNDGRSTARRDTVRDPR
jgi:hypothetical protein